MNTEEPAMTESNQARSAVERIRAVLPRDFTDALGDEALARLLACYSEPWRHYHNLLHIAEVLEVAERFGVLSTWEFTLALLYHDAVYNPVASDNEARSAELVTAELSMLPVGSALRHVDPHRAAELVMATAHHATDREFDAETGVLLDCDCAILGAPRLRYAEYARGVRAEYAHVPDQVFEAGRSAFLKQLSSRARLYHRADFEAEFGARARSNLDWELSSRGVYKLDAGR
jgi:predicted metal-dependent HD superfamily phosphohydrolase